MPVVEVLTHRVRVPMHAPFVTAARRTEAVHAVLVELRDEDGRTGWGEGTENWRVTGDNLDGVEAAVHGPLTETVAGRDPDAWETLTADIAHAVQGNAAARSAVDCAVHELAARRRGIPLAGLLGGAAGRLPTDVTVSVGEPAGMAADAAQRAGEGFDTLKIKVGTGGPAGADDVERLRAVRRAVGPAPRLRLDANQGWSVKQAVSVIGRIEDAGVDVELVEQPVPAGDLDGMARVTRSVATPVLADESVWSASDLLELVRRGATDLVNVKLAKCGGLRPARALVSLAGTAGVGVLFGSMMETHVGVGAVASLAAATPAASHLVHDLDAPWWLTRSPVHGGLAVDGAGVVLPGGGGLAIEGVDPSVRPAGNRSHHDL